MMADRDCVKCGNENCPNMILPSNTKGPPRKYCSPECRKSVENKRQKLKKRGLRDAGFESPKPADPEEEKKEQERRLKNFLNPLYFN